jgi:predicted Zn-dependent peptidase
MRLNRKVFSAIVFFALSGIALGQASRNPHVELKETRLANGLRVITVEDHSAPVIAVDVTYNVGSRNERPGRTGFAPLCSST